MNTVNMILGVLIVVASLAGVLMTGWIVTQVALVLVEHYLMAGVFMIGAFVGLSLMNARS